MTLKRSTIILVMIAIVAISVVIAIAGISAAAKKVGDVSGTVGTNEQGGRDLSIILQETLETKAIP